MTWRSGTVSMQGPRKGYGQAREGWRAGSGAIRGLRAAGSVARFSAALAHTGYRCPHCRLTHKLSSGCCNACLRAPCAPDSGSKGQGKSSDRTDYSGPVCVCTGIAECLSADLWRKGALYTPSNILEQSRSATSQQLRGSYCEAVHCPEATGKLLTRSH